MIRLLRRIRLALLNGESEMIGLLRRIRLAWDLVLRPRGEVAKALSLSCAALEVLEGSEEWNYGTCQWIAFEAVERGFGFRHEQGWFERTAAAAWLAKAIEPTSVAEEPVSMRELAMVGLISASLVLVVVALAVLLGGVL